MGAHASLEHNSLRLWRVPRSDRHLARQLWTNVMEYSFDTLNFNPLKQFPDLYVTQAGQFISTEELALITLEFKRFLFMAGIELLSSKQKKPTTEIVPPPSVDRLWRIILTNSKLYERFCRRVFRGKFLHRDTKHILKIANYKSTHKVYTSYFGPPNPYIWPDFQNQGVLECAYRYIRLQPELFNQFSSEFKKYVSQKNEIDSLTQYRRWIGKVRENAKAKLRGQSRSTLRMSLNGRDEDGSQKEDPQISLQQLQSKLASQASYIEVNRNIELAGIPEESQVDMEESLRRTFKVEGSLMESINKEKPMTRQISRVDHDQISIDSGGLSEVDQEGEDMFSESDQNRQDESDISEEEKELLTQHFSPRFEERTSRIRDSVSAIASIIENEGGVDHLKENWKHIMLRMEIGLKKVKFSPIVLKNFKNEMNLSQAETKYCFEEFKRFLVLTEIVKDTVRLIPSVIVHFFWEYYIIETQTYQKFCEDLRGKFIPSLVLSRVPTKEQENQFTLTLQLYRAVYLQEPSMFFWGRLEDRFNYDEIYSFKYVNIWNLMTRMIKGENLEVTCLGETKVGKKRSSTKVKKDIYVRQKSIQNMEIEFKMQRVRGYYGEHSYQRSTKK